MQEYTPALSGFHCAEQLPITLLCESAFDFQSLSFALFLITPHLPVDSDMSRLHCIATIFIQRFSFKRLQPEAIVANHLKHNHGVKRKMHIINN